jgi:hypothetical protein
MSMTPGLKAMAVVCRRTPVLDHADAVLYFADRAKVQELLERRDVGIVWRGRRIQSIRMQGPDPGLMGGSHSKPGLGSPHRRENYYNPQGAWHLDRIPSHLRPAFEGVVRSIAA